MDIHKLPPSLTPLDLPEPSDESVQADTVKSAASAQGAIAPDKQFPDTIQSGPDRSLVADLQRSVGQTGGEGGGGNVTDKGVWRMGGEGGGGGKGVEHELRQVGGEGGGGGKGVEHELRRVGGEGGGGGKAVEQDLRPMGGEGGGGGEGGDVKTVVQELVHMGGEGGGGGVQDVASAVRNLVAGDREEVQPDEGRQPGLLDPNLLQHHKHRRA